MDGESCLESLSNDNTTKDFKPEIGEHVTEVMADVKSVDSTLESGDRKPETKHEGEYKVELEVEDVKDAKPPDSMDCAVCDFRSTDSAELKKHLRNSLQQISESEHPYGLV